MHPKPAGTRVDAAQALLAPRMMARTYPLHDQPLGPCLGSPQPQPLTPPSCFRPTTTTCAPAPPLPQPLSPPGPPPPSPHPLSRLPTRSRPLLPLPLLTLGRPAGTLWPLRARPPPVLLPPHPGPCRTFQSAPVHRFWPSPRARVPQPAASSGAPCRPLGAPGTRVALWGAVAVGRGGCWAVCGRRDGELGVGAFSNE